MIQGLFILGGLLWFAGIICIIKGWGRKKQIYPRKKSAPLQKKEQIENNIEINIDESPPKILHEEKLLPTNAQIEEFYKKLGRSNVLEFPAEYINKETVRSLSGGRESIIDFAKDCYCQIGFQCINSIISNKEPDGAYKVALFDLLSDHYRNTDEVFVDFFGSIKEKFKDELASIDNHPDMTSQAKKAMIGRHDVLPQLIIWNDRELFLVMVKSRDEGITREEMEFFNRFIVEKKLFNAKVFKVIDKKKSAKGA